MAEDRPSAVTRPQVAVLAVTRRGNELLLVQRRNPPDALKWGYPGGRVELGETVVDAARRELLEETGVDAEPRGVLTVLDSIFRDAAGDIQFHFALIAIGLDWRVGEAVAADDAAAVDWMTLDDMLRADRPMSRDVVAVARLALAAPGS